MRRRGREKRRREGEIRKKEEEEEEKESQGMKLCMEIDIAWYGNFGKDACLEILLENTCLSWVRKTITLQYMCILVGLS